MQNVAGQGNAYATLFTPKQKSYLKDDDWLGNEIWSTKSTWSSGRSRFHQGPPRESGTDEWIVLVLLLILSGWKCLPEHFTGGFRICFPGLQLKGSRWCQCVRVGIHQFIWLVEKLPIASSRTLCILDTFKSNLCSSCNYTSQKILVQTRI